MSTPAQPTLAPAPVTPTAVPQIPVQQGQAPVDPDTIFTAQQVRTMMDRVRAEEKDKLYPQLTKKDDRTLAMEAELETLKTQKQQSDEAEARRDAETARVKRAAEEAELTARELAERIRAESQQEIAALRADNEKERALAAKEREFSRIESYKNKRIDQVRDEIEPHIIGLVSGSTEPEIEASIASLIEASKGILDTVKQVRIDGRAQMQGVAPTAGNTGYLDGDGQPREITAEDVQAMDHNQYAAYRQQAGIAQSNPGWFGSSYNDRIGR